jgi:cyclin-dependent kinase-like
LLVSKNGVLKLCDFGFARTLEGAGSKYTDYVSTRWYRAPELLVGDREYGKPVDIWAVGCMFAEIITGVPLFPGKSDIDQLFRIINCFGLLPERQFQIFQQNPMFQNVELPNPSPDELETLEKRYPGFTNDSMSLMKLCLHQEPDKRGTFEELIAHPYFDGVDKWYNSEMKNLLDKDGMGDLSRLIAKRPRERTPPRKDKKKEDQEG